MIIRCLRYVSIVIIIVVICFILFSRETYKSSGGSFIPSMYYPFSLMLGLILIVVLNKFIFKGDLNSFVGIYSLFIVILVSGSMLVKYYYEPVLDDYYKTYKKSTLLGFNDYKKEKGNLYTIHKSTKELLSVKEYILEGYSTEEAKKINGEVGLNYFKYKGIVSYYIKGKVEGYLVFYDWKNDKLKAVYKRKEYVELAKKELSKKYSIDINKIEVKDARARIDFNIDGESISLYPYFENEKLEFAVEGLF